MSKVVLVVIILFFSLSSIAFAEEVKTPSHQAVNRGWSFGYLPKEGFLVLKDENNSIEIAMNFLLKAELMKATGTKGQLTNGGHIPLAKYYLYAKYFNWDFNFSYNFSSHNKLDNLNIGYNSPGFDVSVGQASPSFGLENNADDDAITFLWWSLPVFAFSPSYGRGVFLALNNQHFAMSASAMTPRVNQGYSGSAPWGETFRLIYVPIHHDAHVLHFGADIWNQDLDNESEADFSTQPEIDAPNGGDLVDTGDIKNSKNYMVGNLEFAYQYNSFETQAEYFQTWVHRQDGLSTLQFYGYYVMANYFLTGESRHYSYPGGYFIGITPIRHKYGALQVALRYSTLDLNDETVRGGVEHNYTVALNWYPLQRVEIMLNYIRALTRPDENGNDLNANIYGIQLQWYF